MIGSKKTLAIVLVLSKGVFFVLALLLLLASCSTETEVSVAESSVVSAPAESQPPALESTELLSLLESITVTPGLGRLPDAPPGAFTPVERMSKADQSLVGETVGIVLAPWDSGFSFHYCFDSASGEERLTLVGNSLALVCRTELDGIEGLHTAIGEKTPVACEILSVTSIMLEETMYVRVHDTDVSKVLVPGMGLPAVQEAFGSVDNTKASIIFNDGNPSERFQSIRSVYTRMYTRYGLEDLFAK